MSAGVTGTGTVHRVVQLLASIASINGEIGVGELAQRLGLPIPTIHRLLHLLRDDAMVEWNPATHKYSVGPEMFRIAAQVMSNVTAPSMAQREIERVSEQIRETVLFGLYQPANATMSFAARAEGSHPLQYRIQMHTPLSLVWGASGKAILAFLPEDVVTRALAAEREDSKSGAPPPTREQLEQELARVRKNGYAVSEGEKLLGARGVAAPVFNRQGIVGSMCITSPKERVPIDRITEFGEIVKAAAERLSRTLGADAPAATGKARR
jgi:DNA-binding IclR family transcriptional regulator